MHHVVRLGRPDRRRLTLVAGVAITLSLVVLHAASTVGTGNLGSFTPLGAMGVAAVEPVKAQLWEDCLSLQQATALLSTALAEAEIPDDYSVRTDGGILSRIGEFDSVKKHLAKGCYTYAGMGSDPSGHRVFYFAGPETLREAEAFWAGQAH